MDCPHIYKQNEAGSRTDLTSVFLIELCGQDFTAGRQGKVGAASTTRPDLVKNVTALLLLLLANTSQTNPKNMFHKIEVLLKQVLLVSSGEGLVFLRSKFSAKNLKLSLHFSFGGYRVNNVGSVGTCIQPWFEAFLGSRAWIAIRNLSYLLVEPYTLSHDSCLSFSYPFQ